MIHADFAHGDFQVNGTGLALFEEYQSVTDRLAYLMKTAGMDKEWIADKLHRMDMLAIARSFPEIEEYEQSPIEEQILRDFFKKN